MRGQFTYFDITDLLRDAASELNEGEFIAGKDFRHIEAMRAIDISDPKVDVGMGLMGVQSIKCLAEHGTELFAPSQRQTKSSVCYRMMSSCTYQRHCSFSFIRGSMERTTSTAFIRCCIYTTRWWTT